MKIKNIFIINLTIITVLGVLFSYSQKKDDFQAFGITTEIINPNNARIWFSPGTNWASSNATMRLRIVKTNIQYTETGNWLNTQESSKKYVYFDVPKADLDNGASNELQFLRFNDLNNFEWNWSPEIQYTAGDNSKVYFMADVARSGTAPTQGTVPNVDAGLAVVVLAGYLTCSPDVNNGYGKFDQVALTWILVTIWEGSFKTVGFLSDHDITDYAGQGISPYSSSRTNLSVNGFDKFQGLKSEFLTN
jgi:hypothetical protein